MVNLKKIWFTLLPFYLSTFLPFFTGCAVPKSKPQVVPLSVSVVAGIKSTKQTVKKVTIIKIGIIENTDVVSISSEDDIEIADIKTGEKFNLINDGRYCVKIINGKIIFGKMRFGTGIKIIPKKNEKKIIVNGKKYRGNIIVKINDKKKVTVINELGVEEYVCGIMTKEVSPDWPIESLKAQAVVARTYAIKNVGKHSCCDFDLCSKTHCQVYGGSDSEDERSNRAVYDTVGEVLTSNGEIINAFYHSNCGGRTEDVENVWGDSETNAGACPEYLSGVKCGFCKQDRWYNWSAVISLKSVYNGLRASGYKIGDIKKIKTIGRTVSDRVKEVLIEHSKGNLYLRSHKFRMAINPNTIRSTNFSIKIKKGVAHFTGHGWGHGVGMCQWGAKGMADDGWDYKKILKHYYRGSEIVKSEE